MLTNDTSSAPPFPGARVNLLLVDDEARNLDVLESVLQSAEYNLVRAETAERALMLLLEGDFAAIVLDIQMPGMNGIELANLIKQRRRTQHIPIIFLTAYFQEDKDILEGYDTGAVDYLTKPINPQILRSKIAVFADLFRKTRALAASNAALELEVVQRQKAEESLRQINNELESRVEARTADLVHLNAELVAREKALRESEAQLRWVTDNAPVFITQIDTQHCFKFVNRTYARRFGFEPEQLIGKSCADVMGEGPYEVIRPQLDAALAGARVEFETEVLYASLGPRWVFMVHQPERAADGKIVGLVAVITDITDRKVAERAVAAARDEAIAASRTKDDFLARLSHELRTPLNPVLLLASEAAGNIALPANVRSDFELIAQNVTLEARLIDDLLDLTAITRGKLTVAMRPVSIHRAIHEALAMVRAEVAQKNLRVRLQLDAERHEVLGDEVRLKQVFWNVLRNSVKFTPAAGEVIVSTINEAKRIVIRIADTGIGLTAAEMERIFSAFAQGDHAARGQSQFGGLGLGLAIARTLVELHAGVISVTSMGRDQGSTFAIDLPLCGHLPGAVNGESPAAPAADGGPALANAASSAPAVLVVEDHAPTSSALRELLTRRHYRVRTATGIADAFALAESEEFDFVISDLGLPDGNGFDLMAEIHRRHGIAGIALTGYGTKDDVSRSRAAGFVTHLTKPVNVHALDQALSLVATAQRPAPAR